MPAVRPASAFPLAAAAAVHFLPAAAQPLPVLRPLLGIASATAYDGVALTFDDGPHPAGTIAVLDALAAHDAKATFFLVGEQTVRYPDVAREIVAAGHQLGVHGDRHRNLLRLTPRQAREDLDRGAARIADATGVEAMLYRPPYGILSAAALRHARRRGWRTLLWTHWGRDWEPSATVTSIATRLTGRLERGSVLLLHDADHYAAPDSWRATAAAVPRVLAALEANDLAPVPA